MIDERIKPEGRIHFAGDFTTMKSGWVEGAIESGLRAARQTDLAAKPEAEPKPAAGNHGLKSSSPQNHGASRREIALPHLLPALPWLASRSANITPDRIIPDRPRLLGVEDSPQRRGNGASLPNWQLDPDGSRRHPRASRHSSARRPRFFSMHGVALGFLERENGIYRNTAETDAFFDKNKPSAHRWHPRDGQPPALSASGTSSPPALRTGNIKTNRRAAKISLRPSMPIRRSWRISPRHDRGQPRSQSAIAQKFPWSQYQSCADIGTAQGDLVSQIALANPHLKCLGFDLPEVARFSRTM